MAERRELLDCLLKTQAQFKIAAFLADPEFIGGDWLGYLRLMYLVGLVGFGLENEFLMVATDLKPEQGLSTYGLRWGIETLLGCLKSQVRWFQPRADSCQPTPQALPSADSLGHGCCVGFQCWLVAPPKAAHPPQKAPV